jgi:hypothetical protein
MAAPVMGMGGGPELNGIIPTRSASLRSALEAAERGEAVIPVCGKQPATPNGYKGASRAPSRITATFNAAPNATGYGIATGTRSGLMVLDIDTPEALTEAKRRGLPETRTVKTGRGVHLYYRLPEGLELRSRDLAPGLELKAEGRYVVGPGSAHPDGGRYTVVKDLSVAEAPAWLLEEPEPHSASAGPRQSGSTAPLPMDDTPIPKGERDTTLTRIAGHLHDGTRDEEALRADLAAINAARCQPPKTARDVARIARSVFSRSPCKPHSPKPDAETLAALREIEAALWSRGWPGMGGKSDRDVYAALILLARQCGRLIPAGVRVSVSYSELALRASVSRRALLDYRKGGKVKPGIITRLRRAGLIRSDNHDRGTTEAGAFVLLLPRAEFHHSSSAAVHLRTPEYTCGETLRAPLRAPRLRHSAPDIKRLGKTRGAVVDALEAAGGKLPEADLLAVLQVKRPRDFRRRVLPPLLHNGVVECSAGEIALAPGYLEALERRRLRSGEIAAETRDRERYKRQSEERKQRLAGSDERLPVSLLERAAVDELRELREQGRARRRFREERRKMRDLAELERVAGAEPGEAARAALIRLPEPRKKARSAKPRIGRDGLPVCMHGHSATWCLECGWRRGEAERTEVAV